MSIPVKRKPTLFHVSPVLSHYYHTHTSYTKCAGGFPQKAILWRPLDVLQLNSILILPTWRQHQITQRKNSVPRDSPHLQVPITSNGSQVTHNFCWTWLQIGGSHEPLPLGFVYLLNISQNSWKHLLRRRETILWRDRCLSAGPAS